MPIALFINPSKSDFGEKNSADSPTDCVASTFHTFPSSIEGMVV
jgi:hypothetical protein